MSRKKYIVDLSDEERGELQEFVRTGEHRAEDITRAKILLKADDGLTDAEICEHVGCGVGTPHRTRKAYSERGIAAIHRRKPDRDYTPKLHGRGEAHLVASPALSRQKDALAGRMHFLLTALLLLRRSSLMSTKSFVS